MRKLLLTSFASVALVVLFFEGGQATDVRPEFLEIRDSNDQDNKTAECADTLTITGNIYHAQQQAFYINAVPNTVFRGSNITRCCVATLERNDYVVTPGIGAHKIFKQNVTWNTARDICVRDGAQLAVINSDEEEQLFRTWKAANSAYGIWIGVHDLFQQGWWTTLVGEPVASMSYDIWADNRPDNAGGIEHCGVVWDLPAKGIDDCPCDRKYGFICEIELC